jgi:hypothetical protein
VPGLDGPAIRSGSHSTAALAAVSGGAFTRVEVPEWYTSLGPLDPLPPRPWFGSPPLPIGSAVTSLAPTRRPAQGRPDASSIDLHAWDLCRSSEPEPLSGLFVSQLQGIAVVADQACACPNEQ